MTEVPKIVVTRLAAAAGKEEREAAHPDVDLLNAFAEQGLSGEERESVLTHLAACQDCRDAVLLSLPMQESLPTADVTELEPVAVLPKATPASKWLSVFGWPSLRWAALATGVIVGSALLLTRHGNPPVAQNSPVAVSSPTSPVPNPTSDAQQVAAAPVAASHPVDEFGKNDVEPGILTGQARRDSLQADPSLPAGPRALGSPAHNLRESTGPAGTMAGTQAEPSTANDLMARNDAPAIQKAKPVPPDILDQKTASIVKKDALAKQEPAPNISLRIAAGMLQRSVDDGASWQAGPHTDRPLTCFVQRSFEVWAGGEAGILYRSVDGGVSWSAVQPVVNAQSLTTDIVNMQFGANSLMISTRDQETWITRDSGQTWEKK